MKRFIINSKEVKLNALEAVKNILGSDNLEVIIRPHKEDKTAEQRGFWHVLIGIMAKEAECKPEYLKEWLKQEILGTDEIDFSGVVRKVTASSEKQSLDMYSFLIEETYRISAEAGIILPNPRYRE